MRYSCTIKLLEILTKVLQCNMQNTKLQQPYFDLLQRFKCKLSVALCIQYENIKVISTLWTQVDIKGAENVNFECIMRISLSDTPKSTTT